MSCAPHTCSAKLLGRRAHTRWLPACLLEVRIQREGVRFGIVQGAHATRPLHAHVLSGANTLISIIRHPSLHLIQSNLAIKGGPNEGPLNCLQIRERISLVCLISVVLSWEDGVEFPLLMTTWHVADGAFLSEPETYTRHSIGTSCLFTAPR